MLAQDKYVEGVLTREDALSMLQEKRIYNYLGRDVFKEIQFYLSNIYRKGMWWQFSVMECRRA